MISPSGVRYAQAADGAPCMWCMISGGFDPAGWCPICCHGCGAGFFLVGGSMAIEPLIFSTAVGKSQFSIFWMNPIASPEAPHPKQWKNSFSSLTVKDGDFS